MPFYQSGELIKYESITELYDRSLTVYGIKIVAGAEVSGNKAVPDDWVYKTAKVIQLLLDPEGQGIDSVAQENAIKILEGASGTFHAGLSTVQRTLYGSGDSYESNPLRSPELWKGLDEHNDIHVSNDMVWYRNIESPNPPTGRNDTAEIMEHVLHTIHMLGIKGAVEGSLQALNGSDQSSEVYKAMDEAVENGAFDLEGYGGSLDRDLDFTGQVILKEYLYLLTFGMWEYNEFWDGGSLAPEWSDSARTPEGVLDLNPLGYALFTKYLAPIISQPSKEILLDMFQDNDQGAHGYLSDTIERNIISLIVEEGIVSESALTVSDLNEEIVRNGQDILSHTIEYGSQVYEYQDVDQFIMVYLRNDEFSEEYQKEIADSFPDYSTVSYSEVVSLVGISGMSDVILQIAGADGTFVV
jgi:hypothetical protein|tara:strand:+ start:400 stop:1638 length:1239 start_codon:yes stop_codon:yes gene_type:complete